MERTASSVGAKSLFPKGPSFSLDDFSSKDFIVRDFIDDLAGSAVPANRRSGPSQPAFDPKPLIRTFESMRPRELGSGWDDEMLTAPLQMRYLNSDPCLRT